MVGERSADNQRKEIKQAGLISAIASSFLATSKRSAIQFAAQRGIVNTGLIQKRRALRRVSFERGLENLFHLLPAFWCH